MHNVQKGLVAMQDSVPQQPVVGNRLDAAFNRHDGMGRRFDGIKAPAASLAPVSQRALAHAFPLIVRKGYAKFAFASDPYTIYAIGVEDQDGFHPFNERHDLKATGNENLPFELIVARKPRHIREALDFAESWVRIVLDGQPVSQRSF
jgi:hypothetical protein